MSEITPEFSRRFRLDNLGGEERKEEVAANAAECAALARRFGFLDIASLSTSATLQMTPNAIIAKGVMRAKGNQACVVTGEPLPFDVKEQFTIHFVADDAPDADEIELSEADCDIVPHDGNAVDLGEAVAQTLGLALDPFPRGPNAEAALKKAGVLSEGEAGPFGALAALKDKLEGKDQSSPTGGGGSSKS